MKERISKRDNKRSRHRRPGTLLHRKVTDPAGLPLRVVNVQADPQTTKEPDLYSRNYDDLAKDFYQLARLACLESTEDVELYIVRMARKYGRRDPDLGAKLAVLSSYTGSPLK